jgi:hypothetical protein
MALIIAVIVPVLFVGIGALVIDVGGWYVGRAQDQNGADAAAVAVANTCAAGICDTTVASKYIDAGTSPNGDLAHQALICGLSTGLAGDLNPCPNGLEATDETPDAPCPKAHGSNYVDVLAQPVNADDSGRGTMTSLFNKGNQAIAACAQASFGGVGSSDDLGFTISKCEWDVYTDDGASYATAPFMPAQEAMLISHGTNMNEVGDPPCPAGPANQDPGLPGGFGFTAGLGGKNGCTVHYNTDGTYDPVSGNNPNCKQALTSIIANYPTPVTIPLYNSTAGGQYTVWAFASIVVTGAWIPGYTQPSILPGSSYAKKSSCPNSDWCISAVFVSTETTDPGGGPNAGALTTPGLTG